MLEAAAGAFDADVLEVGGADEEVDWVDEPLDVLLVALFEDAGAD